MSKLKDCYDRIETKLGEDTEYGTEPFESVALVEKYRQDWKPEKIKIILLAESHVFTTQEDMSVSLHDIKELPGYSKEYAKFVYCLGYGEPELTSNSSRTKRDGTWQFWKIFYSCNNHVSTNDDFRPILKITPYRERLSNKIELLKSLRHNGIWLVDASIVALYPKKEKTSTINNIIKTSWEHYTKSVVEDANPEGVICIGKGVYNILKDDLRQLFNGRCECIFQPNAHLSAKQHLANYIKCSEICRNHTF